MKVIIDGVFNHCGSFNKWMDREHIYSSSDDVYECGAYENTRVHITVSLSFMVINGQTIVHMTAGGGMIRFLSLTMRNQRSLRIIYLI